MRVYTFGVKSGRAKLFQNGGSQAVRLPRDCRFPAGASEVIAKRIGRRVVLEPVEELPDQFLDALGSLSGDLPRPRRVPITKLRDPFS
jgi:antitoxin VapB